jgi:hypothetical protein
VNVDPASYSQAPTLFTLLHELTVVAKGSVAKLNALNYHWLLLKAIKAYASNGPA